MLKDKYTFIFTMGVVLQAIYIIGVAISSEDSDSMLHSSYSLPVFFSCLFMIVGLLGMLGAMDKIFNRSKK